MGNHTGSVSSSWKHRGQMGVWESPSLVDDRSKEPWTVTNSHFIINENFLRTSGSSTSIFECWYLSELKWWVKWVCYLPGMPEWPGTQRIATVLCASSQINFALYFLPLAETLQDLIALMPLWWLSDYKALSIKSITAIIIFNNMSS